MSDAREHHLEVRRSARYWTLGEPQETKDVWFVLHGYMQLARRFLRRFQPIQAPGRLIVAPEGLSRFYVRSVGGRHGAESVVGASWMTREDRETEIADYVAYLDRLAGAVLAEAGSDAEVTVLGFSQGVAPASRWVTSGRVRPRRLVLWGDFLPPDLDMARAAEAWRPVDVVLVRGTEDGALQSEELAAAEAEGLERAGLNVRHVVYEGGHDIHTGTLSELAGTG